MTKAEAALLKALEGRRRADKRWDEKIAKLREALGECTHPVTTEFQWQHDNGYGRQKMLPGLRCTLCLKENRWPGMSQLWG